MAIRYKVVNKDTRFSALITVEKYRLQYVKDKIVEALSGTLGVMVFKRKWQAQRFIDIFFTPNERKNLMIVRVEVFNKGRTPRYVSRWINLPGDLNNFYLYNYKDKQYIDNCINMMTISVPIKGTLCYDRVKVID